METKGGNKKFVTVNLPTAFVADMEKLAKLAGRTVSEQIAHYVEIGKNFEMLVPERLPTKGDNILEAVAGFLVNKEKSLSSLAAQLKKSPFPQFGVDPAKPEVVIKMLRGKEVARGRFDGSGNFIEHVPVPVITGKRRNLK